jgi:OCT family organic cation transporter-like MFS transporter 4/5
MVVSMVFYGLSLNTGILYGNYYVNYLLSVMVEVPGRILPYLSVDRIGRKKSHLIYMAGGGIACLGTIFTVNFGGEGVYEYISNRN